MNISSIDPGTIATYVSIFTVALLKLFGICALIAAALPAPITKEKPTTIPGSDTPITQVPPTPEKPPGKPPGKTKAKVSDWSTQFLSSKLYIFIYKTFNICAINIGKARNLNDPTVQRAIVSFITSAVTIYGAVQGAKEVSAHPAAPTPTPPADDQTASPGK